jgi:hypothetical protein
VTINITAATVVILPRKLVGPAEPKSVWLDPPKAAPYQRLSLKKNYKIKTNTLSRTITKSKTINSPLLFSNKSNVKSSSNQ